MDIAFAVGLLAAFGSLYAMIALEGASVSALFLPAPMILVFGGTIAVAIASGTLKDTVKAVQALPRAFMGKQPAPASVIPQIIEYVEVARSQGALALEEKIEASKDPLVRKALQALADGTDAEDIRTLLEDEIASAAHDRSTAAKFYMTMGGYAPTVGIIGTVVSLTHVLESLSQPDELGHKIAAAFVATLWGVLSANFMWLPIGNRLTRLGELEQARMEVVVEGMYGIAHGDSVHMVRERLVAMAGSPDSGKGARGKQVEEQGGAGAASPADEPQAVR